MLGSHHVVVSSFGAGAGIYLLSVAKLAISERVSSFPATGMDFSPRRWAVVKRLDPSESDDGEIVAGNRRRGPRLLTVEGAADAHAVQLKRRRALVVSSYRATFHLADLKTGKSTMTQAFDGEVDHWHPNDLCTLEGDTWSTFFCDPSDGPTWTQDPRGRGFLLNLRTKERIGSFTYPHSPTPKPEGIYVCDSGESAVVLVDRTGQELRRQKVSGFTRGLLVEEDYVFVGVSTHRLVQKTSPEATESRVHVLDRKTLREIAVVDVPATEVYAIRKALPWQVEALRRLEHV